MVGRTGAARRLPEMTEGPKKRSRRRRIKRRFEFLTVYGLFVAVAVGLVLLYMAQYAYVAQLNLRLTQAQKQLARLQTENEQLEQKASELKSLRRIEEKAINQLGMQKPEQIRTVKTPPDSEQVLAAKPIPAPGNVEENNVMNHWLAFLNWTRGLRKAFAHESVDNY
ncbi:MAG TPA: cell division protein FtsL [bacterium]|nr:cell division protein FtsL [bacterium]